MNKASYLIGRGNQMQTPVNENATKNARALLNYLSDTAGHAIITGQHTQTNYMEEAVYIREKTG